MNQQDIEQVVKAVLLKMKDSSQPAGTVNDMGVFASLDDAVAAATVAQQGLKRVAMRQQVIQAIREAGEKYARELAELAVTETSMGRVEDKFAKNVAQARGTPGVECLTPQVLTGDNGLTLIENAPWGVVASVTPSTNPAATVINNAISLIAAGNSVVFAPHPAAKKVSQRAITLLNQAVVAAGGPANLLVTVANPDIDTAQRLFKYPGIGLLVVTGGEAVVEAARKHTNKRLIAAGAGNPPVVVDETADLPRAAQAIVKGASFDNNIICADEKVLIVVDSVADELMRLMEGQQAVKLTAAQAEQLQPLLLKNIDERGKGTVSRDWVGRDAGKIAAAIGLQVPAQTRLLFVETPASHPFAVTELMMPVLPVVRVANVEEAIALAVQLEGGCHHTAAMHSRNIDNMNQMANAIDTSIFVKNGPCTPGCIQAPPASHKSTIPCPAICRATISAIFSYTGLTTGQISPAWLRLYCSASSSPMPRFPARVREIWWPPVASSAEYVTLPCLTMAIPVVPPPISTTPALSSCSRSATAVGSSST